MTFKLPYKKSPYVNGIRTLSKEEQAFCCPQEIPLKDGTIIHPGDLILLSPKGTDIVERTRIVYTSRSEETGAYSIRCQAGGWEDIFSCDIFLISLYSVFKKGDIVRIDVRPDLVFNERNAFEKEIRNQIGTIVKVHKQKEDGYDCYFKNVQYYYDIEIFGETYESISELYVVPFENVEKNPPPAMLKKFKAKFKDHQKAYDTPKKTHCETCGQSLYQDEGYDW